MGLFDLNQFSHMPIGKYKGAPVGDIGRNDSAYLTWFQINTKFDVVDFEAVTGLAKPMKSPEAQQQATNASGTVTQHQQGANVPHQAPHVPPPVPRVYPGAVIKPEPKAFSKMVKEFMPSDFSDLSEADFVYVAHMMLRAFNTKYKKSLLDAMLRIDPVPLEIVEGEQRLDKKKRGEKSFNKVDELPKFDNKEDEEDKPPFE